MDRLTRLSKYSIDGTMLKVQTLHKSYKLIVFKVLVFSIPMQMILKQALRIPSSVVNNNFIVFGSDGCFLTNDIYVKKQDDFHDWCPTVSLE